MSVTPVVVVGRLARKLTSSAARRPAAIAATACLAVVGVGCGSGDTSGESAASGGSSASDKPLKVSIVEVAQLGLFDQTVKRYEQTLRQELAPREVTFKVQNAQGDPSLIRSITRNMVSSDADQSMALGTDAVVALAQQERRRPIIAVAMSDPVGAKVAKSLDRPGSNVTGSVDFVDPRLVLEQIARTSPAPKRIGVVVNPAFQNDKVWLSKLDPAAQASGVQITQATISGSGDIPAAARSLAGRVDAILLPPDAVVVTGIPAIANVATANKLPLYITGGEATTKGVLALLGPDEDDAVSVDPRRAFQALEAALPRDRTLVLDGGHFITFACSALNVRRSERFLFSCDFATIGQGLAMAIGASIASPAERTTLIAGDGGLLMSIAERDTAVRSRLPLNVVVINDEAYGQEVHSLAAKGLRILRIDHAIFAVPDLGALGRAFGAEGHRIQDADGLSRLPDLLTADGGPRVIDIRVNREVVSEAASEIFRQVRDAVPA